MKKQTAVEWLEIHLLGLISFDSEELRNKYKEKIKQAKKMEREQIQNDQMAMFHHLNNLPYGLDYLTKRDGAEEFAEQYYEQTYGKNIPK